MSIAPHPPRTETTSRRHHPVDLRGCVGHRPGVGATGCWQRHPYRDLAEATRIAAKAQDVCSVLVAVAARAPGTTQSPRAHLVRLGLLAYVAYSYAMYLIGLPMNRIFLVYVVVVAVSGAALLDGLVRLRPSGWPRTTHRRWNVARDGC